MLFTPEEILKFISERSDHPMRVKELAREMGVETEDYPKFRRTVKKLLDSGELIRLKRGRVGPPSQLNVAVGVVSMTKSGTGFLIREGEPEDILIPERDLGVAMDGDRVMIRLGGRSQGRQVGAVIRILERADRNIVGLYHKGRGYAFVRPDNPRLRRDLMIPLNESMEAREGEKVVAVLTEWTDPYLVPAGKIIERLGLPGEPGVDMLAIVRSFNLPEAFSPEVLNEAEKAAGHLSHIDDLERVDLSDDCAYTIDPFDAKDHDDAIGVTRTQGGYRLGVHIADVSHFVPEGSALDTEAFERGNSVYLPGMVIPMLPEVLSNDVCSLKVDRRRLAHSVIIEYDHQGKVLSWQRLDTIIKSRAKLSYERVQEYFDWGSSPEVSAEVAENLDVARELAGIISNRRFSEGSLDFDLPEAKIILNERGEVLELGRKIRLESHRLIEEFMLAANRVVALDVFRRGLPFLYRVHGHPDMEKLEAFSDMMSRLGFHFPVSSTMRPVQFAEFLEQIKDAPEEDFINELMLRSMQKAVYQRENIGHFGLAFKHYTHFTSPIRRFPDLVVHRLLRRMQDGKYPAGYARKVRSVIDSVGRHCSETERVAEKAERQAIKVKQVAFMDKHVGEEFEGVISGVMPFGFFVRLKDMDTEGLVRVSELEDDYYRYEEDNYRMVGRRSGRVYRLGDPLTVLVVRVDRIASQIDLQVVAAPRAGGNGSRGKRKPEKAPRRKAGNRKKRSRV